MRAPRTKICGLTNETDRDAAVAAGADAVGFVSEVPIETPREIPPERAADLVANTPPFVASVLVTMPASPEAAIELVDRVNPDTIQVHGSLSVAELETLATGIDAALVVSIAADEHDVGTHAAIDGGTGAKTDAKLETRDGAGGSKTGVSADLMERARVADALLVDSASADGGGGTGETHDWERTRALTARVDVPVVLAGGLTPENVGKATRTVEPFAVDVASGVERTGGQKDHDALETFVERASRARAVRS